MSEDASKLATARSAIEEACDGEKVKVQNASGPAYDKTMVEMIN
jgi:hypothetical protein